MRIATDGNVGIGTVTPSYKLDLQGITSTARLGNAIVGALPANTLYAFFGHNALDHSSTAANYALLQYSDGTTYLNASSTKPIYFRIANSDKMILDSNGNLGIGTTSPVQKLHVYSSGGGFEFNPGSTCVIESIDRANTAAAVNTAYYTRGTGYFAWYNGSYTERMRIDGSGNVGIGTSTPATKLDVKGNVFVANAANGNNTIAFGNIGTLGPLNGAPNNLTGSAFLVVSSSTASGAPSHMKFYTTTGGVCGERMRIINDGNIGIGTTAPAYKLEVNGSFAASTKSFKIDHPIKPGKKLIYGSLESPYHGIRLTGRNKLVGGKCKVLLPDYICKLARPESVNIQLTGIKCGKTLYIDDINVPENYFVVAYDKSLLEFNKTYEFFWDFTAIRSDVPELITEV